MAGMIPPGFLVPKEAVFRSGGVETRHADAPSGLAHEPEGQVCQTYGFKHPVFGDKIAGFPHGNMGGYMNHLQAVPVLSHATQHPVIPGIGIMGENFRMPRKMMTGKVDGLLVYRPPYHGGDGTGQGVPDGENHIPEGRLPGFGPDPAIGIIPFFKEPRVDILKGPEFPPGLPRSTR
jgi:hypothetical protein